ncbi:MAG: hypothetical protein SOW66_01585 [Porphyromonas sp.]|nr:hypothetical protein [Porphyromonas sp.]
MIRKLLMAPMAAIDTKLTLVEVARQGISTNSKAIPLSQELRR